MVISRSVAAVIAVVLVVSACSSGATTTTDTPSAGTSVAPVTVETGTARVFPPAPAVPDGPLQPDDRASLEEVASSIRDGYFPAVRSLTDTADPRTLWVLADVLRFAQGAEGAWEVVDVVEQIAGTTIDQSRPWGDLTDHLLAWDLPAPPGYVELKRQIYTTVDPRWGFVFDDPGAELDYRLIGWGGVLIDDRPLGDPLGCARGCIPALDDPALTSASEGGWYPDDRIVFGVEINGDAVAFPKNIMEVHEMVNATIGGRRVAIPYCTLCGSAQVFFTDAVEGVQRPPVLRTSGLLSRSNKVMYDLDSLSVFDTFTGAAVTGPLRERGVVLPQATIVTTTWQDWRTTHPDTLVVAEDGGVGNRYPLDPLGGRDDNGPIFPIGQVDDRLPVHMQVLGVDLGAGRFVAVPADAARETLLAGGTVEIEGVNVTLDGRGLRAMLDGEEIPSHQAFWFAWSQFHPTTSLWLPS
ncbi:MAG: DUF3179 domain-containing (seleno)protein [Acidimicrobiales bacterium]